LLTVSESTITGSHNLYSSFYLDALIKVHLMWHIDTKGTINKLFNDKITNNRQNKQYVSFN